MLSATRSGGCGESVIEEKTVDEVIVPNVAVAPSVQHRHRLQCYNADEELNGAWIKEQQPGVE